MPMVSGSRVLKKKARGSSAQRASRMHACRIRSDGPNFPGRFFLPPSFPRSFAATRI
jgi:hypothetical protein